MIGVNRRLWGVKMHVWVNVKGVDEKACFGTLRKLVWKDEYIGEKNCE